MVRCSYSIQRVGNVFSLLANSITSSSNYNFKVNTMPNWFCCSMWLFVLSRGKRFIPNANCRFYLHFYGLIWNGSVTLQSYSNATKGARNFFQSCESTNILWLMILRYMLCLIRFYWIGNCMWFGSCFRLQKLPMLVYIVSFDMSTVKLYIF